MSKKSVAKKSGLVLSIFFSTLASVPRKNTVYLPNANSINKFVQKYNVDTDYLLKLSVFDNNIYTRCELKENEKIYLCYDDTISDDYKVSAVENSAEYFTKVFSTINPNYQFAAKKVDKQYVIDDNQIYITTGQHKWSDGRISSYENNFWWLGSGNCLDIVQKRVHMQEEGINDYNEFYSTLVHEILHALGIGDAYKYLDEERCFDYQDKMQTIMGYKYTTFGMGEMDYKLLCSLYGNYNESTIDSYRSQISAFSRKVDDYLIGLGNDKMFYIDNLSNKVKEYAQSNGIGTTESTVNTELKNLSEPVYLVDKEKNNLIKVGQYGRYETYDIQNDKLITNKTYNTDYLFLKLSNEDCLLKIDDYYIQANTKDKTFTNIYKPITKEMYETVVHSPSTSLSSDLCQ